MVLCCDSAGLQCNADKMGTHMADQIHQVTVGLACSNFKASVARSMLCQGLTDNLGLSSDIYSRTNAVFQSEQNLCCAICAILT